jgi:AAA family ATP:ADP antiporter
MTPTKASRPGDRPLSALERALGLFTEVRAGEGATGLCMLVGVFLVLAAYYFIKPARDGLLAVSPAGGLSETELKAYSSLGQSLCLVAALPLYDRISKILPRHTLITAVTLFFAANLVVFWALQPGLIFSKVGYVGIAFYLWVGIFNVFIVAQFWSFAADLYSDEAGKRLFPLIAIGGSAGAASGAWMAKRLVGMVGTDGLLLVAGGVLSLSLFAVRSADTRGPEGEGSRSGEHAVQDLTSRDTSGGMRLIVRHKYLVATALLVLVLNWVNSNGENFMFGALEKHLHAEVAARGLAPGEPTEAFIRDQTTRFYGDLFFWVNAVALFLQAVVASRLLRYGGFGAILLALPVISLTAYVVMALYPTLGTIRRMKIAENATDYSLNNTAKQVLWLPTTVDMKYRAKATIDTLFVRGGDAFAAATAFVGVKLMEAPLRALFGFNAVLVLVWLAFSAIIVSEHARLSSRGRIRQAVVA